MVARELEPDDVRRLRAYHERLAGEDRASLLLEGDYAPRDALVPEGTSRPAWWFRGGTLRPPEHMLSADNLANILGAGLVIFGPPASRVLPAVSPAQVRAAIHEMLAEAPELRTERAAAKELLDIARSLAGLATGTPTSRAAGMRWALEHVDGKWHASLRHANDVRAGVAPDDGGEVLRRAVREWRAELGLRS